MNQGRIWCVVNPTVGLPLFLGSVAVTALIVHASVLTHVPWFSAYWSGSKAKTAMTTPSTTSTVASKGDSAFVVTVAPSSATPGQAPSSFVITVTPGAPNISAQASPTEVPEQLVLAPAAAK